MEILIAGSGQSLYFLGRRFFGNGEKVTIINPDHDECLHLAKTLDAVVICGDPSNSGILEESGIRHMDVLLAITPNDQDNLIICQLATLQYGIPRAIALANDPDNKNIFESLGVTSFSITEIIASLMEQRVSYEQIRNLVPIGEGRVNVTEVLLDCDAMIIGKPLKDLEFPDNSLIAVVIRNNQPIIPQGTTRLEGGDRLILITLPENHAGMLDVIFANKGRVAACEKKNI